MTNATDVAHHVHITRTVDAPRARVFAAWTDPDQVARWFGPEGFDTPRERVRIDLEVGGRYELTMVRRDGGGEHAIGYEIIELEEPALLVLRSDPVPGMATRPVVRVEFHDDGDRTRVVLSDGPYPAPAGHAEAGWNGALDKLGGLVSDSSPMATSEKSASGSSSGQPERSRR